MKPLKATSQVRSTVAAVALSAAVSGAITTRPTATCRTARHRLR
jgi:hypothetical protein